MINEPVKPHHAVTFGECNGRVLTWIRGRPNTTVMVVNVTMGEKASSVHKMLKAHVGSCSILEKAHFANASLCAVSAGKSSWHDCNLYTDGGLDEEYWTDDGGKPNRLAVSRALLVSEGRNRFHFDSNAGCTCFFQA
ncbi:hypothetical protein TNCV_3078551 [Trichonephila clavipes]|nr:hypothetical protein TNCV_3078551 [Trichonephila clavipes]